MHRDRLRSLRNSQSKYNLSRVKSSPSLIHSKKTVLSSNINVVSSDCSTPDNTESSTASDNTESCDDKEMSPSESCAATLISLFCVKSKENAYSVSSLPIFQYIKINDLKFLIHFRVLIKLEMVFCKLMDINGLSLCHNLSDTLQILNLSNNKITDLYGIQHLIKLKELHLGENEIISLNAITTLVNLEILDFHDNLIDDLTPITHCNKLKIIRAGNNRIDTVRNHLNEMNCLETLNLSGNDLLLYDEIDAISTIPSLTDLHLNDPHFGSNPICELSNYHIYSLYKLKQIESLDGIKIDAISKKKAQISMYKKTMFYEIKYQCSKRDESALYRVLYQNTLKLYRLLLNNIQFVYKYTSLYDVAAFKNEIDECIKKYNSIKKEIWNDLQSIKNRAEKETRNKFEILKYELKTAGNLRLIECNTDVNSNDYKIIESLIQCKVHDASNIDILSAKKIENKFANYRFDTYCKKMNHSVNRKINFFNDDEIDKIFVIDEFLSTDSTEILSWILKWKDDKEPIKIKSISSIQRNSTEQQIILFVRAFFSQNVENEPIITGCYQLQPLYMVQIVNNIHDVGNKWDKCIHNMPKPLQYLYSTFCDKWPSKLRLYLSKNEDIEMKMTRFIKNMDKVQYDGIHIIDVASDIIENRLKENVSFNYINISFNKCISSASYSMLSAMNNIIEMNLSFNSLKYIPNIFKNMNKLKSVNLEGNELGRFDELYYFGSNSELNNLNLCNNPIIYGSGFVNLCLNIIPSIEILNNEAITYSDNKSPINNAQFIDLFCSLNSVNIKSVFDDYKYIPLKFDDYKHKILSLNLSKCKLLFIPQIISELMHLETLNLSNNFILEINNLFSNKNLKELIVSNNNLRSVNIVCCLSALNKLDVGCNNIEEITSLNTPNLKFISFLCNKIGNISLLSSITSLVEINASFNNISDSNNIYSLCNLEHIAILDLMGNVLSDYKHFAIFCMKSLRMLNGERITESDIQQSSSMYNGRVHHDFLINKIGHKKFETVDVLDLSSCNLSILDKIFCLFIHLKELDLSNNNISDITALLQLKTLRILNLNHNSIQEVASFITLKHLEQLLLSHNKIESISSLNLCGMTQLKFLWLNNNKITHIDGLKRLPRLHSLHLNNNKIRKLSSPFCVASLKELNIENNGLRSLEYIDTLFKNIKICNVSNNRINHLRELKVLHNLPYLFQIMIQNNPITSSNSKSSQCMVQLSQYSNSLQFIGNIDLTSLRSQQKLQLLNDKLDNDYNINPIGLTNPIGLKINKIKQFPLFESLRKK